MLAGKKQNKASLHRKDRDLAPGSRRDVNSAEARRKAAVWAWYQRERGTVYPTRKAVEQRESAAHKDCAVDRPMSRFKAEATRKSSSQDLLSKPTLDRETNLVDVSELSSIAERVQLLVHKLKEEGSSESPPLQHLHRSGSADIKLNEPTSSPSPTSYPSELRTAQPHQLPTERANAIGPRSLSDLPCSRQLHQQTSEEREIHSGGARSTPRAENVHLYGNTDMVNQRKSSVFRRPFSIVRRLFQGSSRWSILPCSEVNTQAEIHHHYYHHHHFYYHHNEGDQELQFLEINEPAVRQRRNSESYAALTEARSPDQHEKRRGRRHSVDVGAKYRLNCSGDGAWDVRDQFCRQIDEGF